MKKIENVDYPSPIQNYKVLVSCFTYNQSKYIEDALNGFVMQQTTFPFVRLVMDDASTDGEQDIIKVWMERECDMSKAVTIEYLTTYPYPKKTSMLQDVLAHRKTEVDYISGDVVRLAHKWNYPCPVNLTMYYLIKSKEQAYLIE